MNKKRRECMKKALCLLMTLALSLSLLFGCGDGEPQPSPSPSTKATYELKNISATEDGEPVKIDVSDMTQEQQGRYSDIIASYGTTIEVDVNTLTFSGSLTGAYGKCTFSKEGNNVVFDNAAINSTFKAFTLTSQKLTFTLQVGEDEIEFEFHNRQNPPYNPPDGDLEFMELEIWAGDEYMISETAAKFNAFLNKFNSSEVASRLNVRLSLRAMTSLPTALSGALTANQGPALVIWDRFFTPSNTEILTPINDLLERDADEINLSLLHPEALKELSYRGTYYGLPLDLDPWGIYINLDNVDEYNAAHPTSAIDVNDLGTWSKLAAAAEKLTKRNGSTVTTAGLNTTSMDGHFFSFTYTAGGEVINTREWHPGYGDTVMTVPPDEYGKRIEEVLYFFKYLYSKNICNNALGGTDAFIEGKLAMTYGSMFFPQTIRSMTSKNVRYKFIPYPKRDLTFRSENGGSQNNPLSINPDLEIGGLTNGLYGGMLGGYGLAIPYPPNSAFRDQNWEKKKERAWMVIKAIIFNDEINRMFFTTTEQITSRVDLHEDVYYYQDSVMKDAIPYLAYYRIRPNVAGYEAFESNVVRANIQKLYEGTYQTIQTCYYNIMEQGNQLLRRAQGRD